MFSASFKTYFAFTKLLRIFLFEIVRKYISSGCFSDEKPWYFKPPEKRQKLEVSPDCDNLIKKK